MDIPDQLAGGSTERESEARRACEALYNLRFGEIGKELTREQVAEHLSQRLCHGATFDHLEIRTAECLQLIESHYDATNPPASFDSVLELVNWYDVEKMRLQTLDIADRFKQVLLLRLIERFSEIAHDIIGRPRR